jgi:UDP-glucose 4-epimerase
VERYNFTVEQDGGIYIMSNVLVTGGAGFIGSHLVHRLLKAGHFVRVIDDLSTGCRCNMKGFHDYIHFIYGDIRSPTNCKLACTDIDYVFHQAAIPSVPKSVNDPIPSHNVNINGTFNMLQAAQKCGVRRFIYAASSSAYGNTIESPKHEGIKPVPLSPYAVQKYVGECYCKAFFECYGLETISLRYFNVFGERQDPKSQYAAAIPTFITSLLKGEAPTVYGDGKQTRDFTYIDNVVEGNMRALCANKTCGEVVNIACGGQLSVNYILSIISQAIEIPLEVNYVDRRPGDIEHSCANIQLAKSLLGFEPIINFEEGIQRTIDFYDNGGGHA